jgi:hypothetical protein
MFEERGGICAGGVAAAWLSFAERVEFEGVYACHTLEDSVFPTREIAEKLLARMEECYVVMAEVFWWWWPARPVGKGAALGR